MSLGGERHVSIGEGGGEGQWLFVFGAFLSSLTINSLVARGWGLTRVCGADSVVIVVVGGWVGSGCDVLETVSWAVGWLCIDNILH